MFAPEFAPSFPSKVAQAEMRSRSITIRGGRRGGCALAGVLLAACAHQEPATLQVLGVDEVETSWRESRQVAVRVADNGSISWEGRTVSREEFQTLMREAVMQAPDLLVLVTGSDQARYGDVVQVVQIAQMYGAETRLGAKPDTE